MPTDYEKRLIRVESQIQALRLATKTTMEVMLHMAQIFEMHKSAKLIDSQLAALESVCQKKPDRN